MIYLDNAATTEVLSSAKVAAEKAYSEYFLNPSALYKNAEEVRKQLTAARETVAGFLHALPEEIYFTSGATEANNWAVFSGIKNKSLATVASEGEHACVYECIKNLKGKGVNAVFVPLNVDTSVNADRFIELAGQNCGFASLIHVSNETGAINDVGGIFSEIRKRNPGVVLHSDGVQAFGKTETDVKKMNVDLYSVSGHKVGAPKGVGALYIRKGFCMAPLLYGGGQERGLRSGTENIPGIMAFAAAATAYAKTYAERMPELLMMRRRFYKIMQECAGNININESSAKNIQNILSMSVIGLKSEILQRVLADESGILIGIGSACAGSKKGNRVLQASGKNQKEIEGNIRISFGIATKAEESNAAAHIIAAKINELRGKIHE